MYYTEVILLDLFLFVTSYTEQTIGPIISVMLDYNHTVEVLFLLNPESSKVVGPCSYCGSTLAESTWTQAVSKQPDPNVTVYSYQTDITSTLHLYNVW